MNLLRVAWKNLWYYRSRTLSGIFLLAVATGLSGLILISADKLSRGVINGGRGIDLVVGAKGSSLQIVLSSIYHVDAPVGNIPATEARVFAGHPLVEASLPLCLGDQAEGFRLVGTTADFKDFLNLTLASGRDWENSQEVIAGSEAARLLNLQPGSVLHSSHGLQAEGEAHHHHLEVCGILAPGGGPLDRLLFVDSAAYGSLHNGAGGAMTALLIRFKNKMALFTLPRKINEHPTLQAASPALEITKLDGFIRRGSDVLSVLMQLVFAVITLVIFLLHLQMLQERQHEWALMRSLGASGSIIRRQMIAEALMLSTLGVAAGWLTTLALQFLLINFSAVYQSTQLGVGLGPELWIFLPLGWGIGLLAVLVPIFRSTGLPLPKILKRFG